MAAPSIVHLLNFDLALKGRETFSRDNTHGKLLATDLFERHRSRQPLVEMKIQAKTSLNAWVFCSLGGVMLELAAIL